MWYSEETGVIKTPRGLKINGKTYPRKIFKNKAKLAELGILPYSEERVDQRYYNTGAISVNKAGDEFKGTYAQTEKDVESLKERYLNEINQQVASKQEAIDWMFHREQKGGKAVPQEVKDYAKAIYATQVEKEAKVNALSSIAQCKVFENTPVLEVRKVKHTSEDGVETYGPETEESNREVSLTMYGWPIDPIAEADPSFVSSTIV